MGGVLLIVCSACAGGNEGRDARGKRELVLAGSIGEHTTENKLGWETSGMRFAMRNWERYLYIYIYICIFVDMCM